MSQSQLLHPLFVKLLPVSRWKQRTRPVRYLAPCQSPEYRYSSNWNWSAPGRFDRWRDRRPRMQIVKRYRQARPNCYQKARFQKCSQRHRFHTADVCYEKPSVPWCPHLGWWQAHWWVSKSQGRWIWGQERCPAERDCRRNMQSLLFGYTAHSVQSKYHLSNCWEGRSRCFHYPKVPRLEDPCWGSVCDHFGQVRHCWWIWEILHTHSPPSVLGEIAKIRCTCPRRPHQRVLSQCWIADHPAIASRRLTGSNSHWPSPVAHSDMMPCGCGWLGPHWQCSQCLRRQSRTQNHMQCQIAVRSGFYRQCSTYQWHNPQRRPSRPHRWHWSRPTWSHTCLTSWHRTCPNQSTDYVAGSRFGRNLYWPIGRCCLCQCGAGGPAQECQQWHWSDKTPANWDVSWHKWEQQPFHSHTSFPRATEIVWRLWRSRTGFGLGLVVRFVLKPTTAGDVSGDRLCRARQMGYRQNRRRRAMPGTCMAGTTRCTKYGLRKNVSTTKARRKYRAIHYEGDWGKHTTRSGHEEEMTRRCDALSKKFAVDEMPKALLIAHTQ